MTTPTPAQTRRRINDPLPEQTDVAIIGAGLGGLVAGALLARAGLGVACLDGHYAAGGCATRFHRHRAGGDYHFDVGLHYIGDCAPGGMIPALLEVTGAADGITFEQLDPDGFDTLHFPGLRFPIPAGHDPLRERLVEHFPSERRGIDRYIRFLRELDAFVEALRARRERFGWGMALHTLLRGRMVARYQNATLGALLDDCTRDPRLRAVIAGQNGDYGLPPGRVAAALHGGLVNHYLRGAYYPRGGGQVIADALAERIEAAGGHVRLRHPVERILLDDRGHAVGIAYTPHRSESRELRARVVLSNADITATLTQLLPPEALPARWQERVQKFEMPPAIFMTCLGIEGSLDDTVGPRNHWRFDTYDFDALYRELDEGPLQARCAYITSASTKDPTGTDHAPEGHSSVEVMTVLSGDPARWGARPEEIPGRRYRSSNAYQATKARIEEDLIAQLDALFPGLRARVRYAESATPVTHSRFTGAAGGSGYGLAATPAQFLRSRPGYRGPIPELYLCGASTRSGHGIVGAMRSGYESARRIADQLERSLPPLPQRS